MSGFFSNVKMKDKKCEGMWNVLEGFQTLPKNGKVPTKTSEGVGAPFHFVYILIDFINVSLINKKS